MVKKKRSRRAAPKRGRPSPRRKPSTRAKARRTSAPTRKKAVRKPAPRRSKPTRRPRGTRPIAAAELRGPGLGPDAGGQSGDIEGLSRAEVADSESVEELVEEGQAFEAGIVAGVENAPDPDRAEIRTREVPEDDVPQEYLDED